ncbi:MAG: LuxR C-terminal-related transcriptional regulator [Spirochaetaceae bacterium]
MSSAGCTKLHSHTMYIYKSRADKLKALLQVCQFSEEEVFYLFLLDSKALSPAKQIATQLNIPNLEECSSFVPAERFFSLRENIGKTVLDLFEDTYTRAIEKGYTALHIMVDMGFLLSFVQYEDILSTESQLDRFYETHRAKGMCIYFYESLSADLIGPLKKSHNEIRLSESLLYSHIEAPSTCQEGGMAENLDDGFAALVLLEPNNWSTLMNKRRKGLELTFSPFLRTINEIIWLIDNTLTFKYVSPRVQDLLGCAPSSLVNRRIRGFLTPEGYEKLDITIQEISDIVAKNPEEKVYRRFYSSLKDSSGNRVEMEHIVYPLVLDKQAVGFMGISRPGSAEEKLLTFSQETLREKWETLWDEMPIGVVLTDANGNIQFINTFFRKLKGISATNRNIPGFEKLWYREPKTPGESVSWTEYSSFLGKLRENTEKQGERRNLSMTTANGKSIRVHLKRQSIQTIYSTELHLYFILPQSLYPPEEIASWVESSQVKRDKRYLKEQFQTKYGLSNREMQVMNHIMEGLQNKEIASFLHIAEVTVKKHLTHIFSKCSVQSRFELARVVSQFYESIERQ